MIMDLDILLYIVLAVGSTILIAFAFYVLHKRKNNMIVKEDGINDIEVLEDLIDRLEDIDR